MPRILGVDIPREKRIDAALPYLYGVGPTLAKKILDTAQIDYAKRAKDLTDEEIAKISNIIQNSYIVEGDLKREVQQNIRRLSDVGMYRGYRHRKGLPVRGQRTKTNARTRKGKKPSIGGKSKSR